jgi:Ni,Fe-hydrogenase I small subunit
MSRDTDARVRERELGLLRLRRVTRSVAAVAVGGCAAFAGIAAASSSTPATTSGAAKKVIAGGTNATRKGTTAAPPTVAAPATAPTFAPSPPVTASGGS